MARIVLGVGGGIAAYKSCELLRRLSESGHDVTPVPTPSALEFVGKATWAALSGKPIRTGVYEAPEAVDHVRIGRETELVVVAPATANLMARAAAGMADDLLTSVLLTSRGPVLCCPAMHTEMWEHPATQANVATLRSRGVVVMDPAAGRLTGADSGVGRLPEPEDIAAVVTSLLADAGIASRASRQDWLGKQVLVTAGGTREPLDPVRFLGNSSSGLMGIALARAARLRGARVTLIRANVTEASPAGVTVVSVGTTAELAAAVGSHAPAADVVIMAAAPADFTPAEPSPVKLKKSGSAGLDLRLIQTPDILANLGQRRRPGQILVGFAAETAGDAESLLKLGGEKLHAKAADLLVVNDVSGGAVFGSAENSVHILGKTGILASVSGDKNAVAHRILDAIV